MEITKPYYEDTSRISNSNIGWFLNKGPEYLRRRLDGDIPDTKAKYLEKGTMIHMYLLQPEDFWQNYIVAADFTVPKSAQQIAFANDFVNSLELEPDLKLVTAYKNNYSTTNKSDDKVLSEATKMAEGMTNYLEYLKLNKDSTKTIITWAEMDMLKRIHENVKKHKAANRLLLESPNTTEAYNEFHINWVFPKTYNEINIECKSLLDRVLFDHVEKRITLIDVKTTMDVNDFATSIEKYDYNRQLSYYWFAIHWYMKNELELNIDEYTFESYIVAIQSGDGYQVRTFKIEPKKIENRIDTIANTLSEISWHMKNNLWEQRREYYENDGVEVIE